MTSQFTRRRVLGGLGVVGAGAALGGTGTLALFTDEETFENNRLVAGELDLKMDWVEMYNGEEVERVPPRQFLTREELAAQFQLDPEESTDASLLEELFRNQFRNVPDDLDAPVIAIDDVKPGDWGQVCFSMHIFDNPAYLWFGGGLLEDADNGITEPEGKSPNEDGTEAGELLDATRARVWYDDGDGTLSDTETYRNGDDTVTISDEEATVIEGSLREVLQALSVGLPLDAFPSTEAPDRSCFANSTTYYLCFAWELPREVENEVQSDSAVFDLSFYAEQCRHNDGERAPLVDVAGGDGFAPVTDPWIGKVRHGGTNTYELEVGNGPGDRAEGNLESFRGGGSVPFSLTSDAVADSATLTVDGATVSQGVTTGDDVVGITAKAPAGGRVVVDDLAMNGQSLFGAVDADARGQSTRALRHLVVSGGGADLGFALTGTITTDVAGVAAGDFADELPAVQIEVAGN